MKPNWKRLAAKVSSLSWKYRCSAQLHGEFIAPFSLFPAAICVYLYESTSTQSMAIIH